MLDVLSNLYPWTKAFHVMSVIAWMAGLFYLPRLFVYHAEKVALGSETDEMFQTMERRLMQAIMTPSMIATWVFGLLLVLTPGVVDWGSGWPWMKAMGVLGITWFHHWCSMRRKDIVEGRPLRTGRQYRIMNEVPTLFMVAIVIAVIVRPF